MTRLVRAARACAVLVLSVPALAAVVPDPGRFDARVLPDPSSRIGTVAETPEQIADLAAGREAWNAFRKSQGGTWNVWLDRRSGAPLLVEGSGASWFPAGQAISATALEEASRRFLSAHGALLGVNPAELVWNASGSGATGPDRATAVFDRAVGGVEVEGESFVLSVVRGNLVAFGATRWGAVPQVPSAVYSEGTAREVLYAHMGLTGSDVATDLATPKRALVAGPAGDDAARYAGPAGGGLSYALAWRFVLAVEGEPGAWVGKVDAVTGKVIAFYDDHKYVALRGGVYPLSNDGDCVDLGCEIGGFPLPYANVSIGRKVQTTGDMGQFTCGKGSKNTTTNLAGPYVRIQDTCGYVNETGNCSADIDLGTSGGTDCTFPAGHNPGDTHASRVNFYLLNRLAEKVRYWLPSNSWVKGTLTAKVNTNSTCNAFWNGSVNFYKSGGGCRNTGEISGVVAHEWGHGLDQNDGGGYDNPSEAYADVVAILQDHRSCVGRGFFQGRTCSGYGDTCLTCTGIRDMDYAARTAQLPATPQNFTGARCGGGGGPCGREVHCESYVPSEAVYDLAARDLPASGMSADSAWQLAERLFYQSRQGSNGNAFNCALPSSDGCNATSWFAKIRRADDDDGNLANGTPHAAAIHAAFARHNIACGLATDASNQNSSSCPALAAPAVTATPGAGSVQLSWPAVPGASKYLVLRNEIGCNSSSNVIATVTGTSYTDSELPSGFPLTYRVQAVGGNAVCESPVSACLQTSGN